MSLFTKLLIWNYRQDEDIREERPERNTYRPCSQHCTSGAVTLSTEGQFTTRPLHIFYDTNTMSSKSSTITSETTVTSCIKADDCEHSAVIYVTSKGLRVK